MYSSISNGYAYFLLQIFNEAILMLQLYAKTHINDYKHFPGSHEDVLDVFRSTLFRLYQLKQTVRRYKALRDELDIDGILSESKFLCLPKVTQY